MSPAEHIPVLVFAPIGRDARVCADLLERVGLRVVVCASLGELTERVDAGAAAVLVAEEGLFGRDISALAQWVERQPPWSDLPFVVLTSHHQQAAIQTWRKELVSLLHHVSLLERPVQAITLTSTLQAAVRARGRQYEVRAHMQARETAAQQLEALVVARTCELEAANDELRTQMAERARIEETLRHAQKIEALGQLTGGVAHDFNNLLMVIFAGLDMLSLQTDPSRRKAVMERMQQAAERGASLTRQLLAFSQRQPLRPEAVDLARHVGSMRELLDRSLRGDVHVRLDFADDLWPVEVDPGELELVVLNLAFNARDAMPGGGIIDIAAHNVRGMNDGVLQGDFVRLSVADTGTGMTPEVKARVFEPFFTTKEVGKGSGLGLPQAYGFAQQSGGCLRIDSEPGEGTRVMLLLPRSTKIPATPHGSRPAVRLDEAAPSAGCVLLVEDDDEVAALVADMLRQIGYRTTRTSNASAALGALANARDVDLVLSDVMMPGGMDGIELAREIRERRPGLPVLLTSGYAEAVRHAAESDGIHILTKPYRIDELATAVTLAISDYERI